MIIVTQSGNSVCATGALDEPDMRLLRYRQVARATGNYEIADEIKAMFSDYAFADKRDGFTIERRRSR